VCRRVVECRCQKTATVVRAKIAVLCVLEALSHNISR